MALPTDDSAVGHSFGLEFDGVTITKIQQVEGLKMEQDVIELKENSNEGKYFLRKLPGRPAFDPPRERRTVQRRVVDDARWNRCELA